MGVAAAIGFFDGVHTGHQHLLRQLRQHASEKGAETVAITFRNHPALIYNPLHAPQCICCYDKRVHLLSKCVDRVVTIDFDSAIARMTADEFVRGVLRGQLRTDWLLMGFNHRFGSDCISDFEQYRQICEKHGITAIKATRYEGQEVSSTIIRNLINQSNFVEAEHLLGWKYEFEGIVTSGYHNGIKIGFPTANMVVDNSLLIPSQGVYACWARLSDSVKPLSAMLNIGRRPTFNQVNAEVSIEVHIIDWNNPRPLYGEKITVIPHSLIRHEANFPSINNLREQLIKDKIVVAKKLRENIV